MEEKLKIIISAEIAKLRKGIEDAKKKVKDFASKSSKQLEEFNAEFSKIGDAAKRGLAVAGGAMVGTAGALLALAGSTQEYRTEQAKLTSAFEAAGGSAEEAKTTYNDLFRVIGDSGVAVEAAAHLAQMTTEEKALTEWTDICKGVYATFGDSLPIEGLTEAANETAKVGTVTGSLADALNWAGISEDAFNEKLAACNTEAEREKLIRETLNGLYADAASTYETNAASVLAQNEAQSRLNDAMAVAGEAIAPVQTALTELGATVLEQLTPYIQDFAANHLPAVTEALSNVGTKIGEVLKWVSDNWTTISTIGTIVLGVAAALSIMSTALSVVGTVMAFIASPFAGIIALIVGISAAIVLCVVYWDEIKETVVKVATAIWEAVKVMYEKVVGWFGDLGEKIGAAAENIKSICSEKFTAAKEAIQNATTDAKDSAVQSLQNMKDAYQKHGGGIKGIASAAMEGVKGYYKTGFTFIDSLTGGKLGNVADKFKSKMELCKTAVSNALTGIKDSFNTKLEDAKTLVSNAVQKIKDFFTFDWSLPKPKLPHFNISGGKAPWGFMGEGSLPSISIEWYAKGGVFDKPTLFQYGGNIGGLGEAGAEAIVPLEKTPWIDVLAEKLSAKQGNTPIVLQVDGKVFAQTSINSINQLTRQTGKLGLNII